MAHNEVISHSGHLAPFGRRYIGGSEPIPRLWVLTRLMYSQLRTITQTVNSTYSAVMELCLERLNAQHDTTAVPGLDDANACIVNIPVHHGIDL